MYVLPRHVMCQAVGGCEDMPVADDGSAAEMALIPL